MIIKRREEKILSEERGWILVYGRRKVGKTFTIRRAIPWDLYCTITRSGNVILEEGSNRKITSQENAIKKVTELLRENKTVVIDEFQRINPEYMEIIALEHPNGRLIASGSSFKIFQEIFSKRSPLLGLFSAIRFEIIRAADVIASISELLKDKLDVKGTLIWGVLLRDPWVIPMFNVENNPIEEISRKIWQIVMTSQSLIGEVFTEEERRLTRTYEAIMRLIAEGTWDLSELASILSSRGLISGGRESITGVLDVLSKIGIITKIPLWKSRKRFYYKISSPIVSIALYADQKLGISEGIGQLGDKGILYYPLGMEFQFSIGELLAEYYNATMSYSILPEGDIDVVLLKRNRPIIAFEISLRSVEDEEIKRLRDMAEKLGIRKIGVVSIGEKYEGKEAVNVAMSGDDIIKIARNIAAGIYGRNI